MQADRRGILGGLAARPDDPDPLTGFRYALDAAAPTITSGGWAKHVTVRRFPVARGISGVHMFLIRAARESCTGTRSPTSGPL